MFLVIFSRLEKDVSRANREEVMTASPSPVGGHVQERLKINDYDVDNHSLAGIESALCLIAFHFVQVSSSAWRVIGRFILVQAEPLPLLYCVLWKFSLCVMCVVVIVCVCCVCYCLYVCNTESIKIIIICDYFGSFWRTSRSRTASSICWFSASTPCCRTSESCCRLRESRVLAIEFCVLAMTETTSVSLVKLVAITFRASALPVAAHPLDNDE